MAVVALDGGCSALILGYSIPSSSRCSRDPRLASQTRLNTFLTYRVSCRGNVADRGDRHRMVQT